MYHQRWKQNWWQGDDISSFPLPFCPFLAFLDVCQWGMYFLGSATVCHFLNFNFAAKLFAHYRQSSCISAVFLS